MVIVGREAETRAGQSFAPELSSVPAKWLLNLDPIPVRKRQRDTGGIE